MELGPVPEEGGHGQDGQVVGDEGDQDDPEEAVEEDEVGLAVRDETAVSIEHEQATEVEAEEECVVVEVTDDVATNDEGTAEPWPQPGVPIKDGNPGKEEQTQGANHVWGGGDVCSFFNMGERGTK